MARLGLFGVAVAMCLALSQTALAQGHNDEEARVHFRLGSAYYESGRFEEAAREFQQAYDLSERPQLLYNVFLAWRDAAQLGPAIEALEAYLAQVPDVRERDSLEARLASMRRLHGQQEAARAANQERETGTTGGTAAETAETTTTGSGTTTTTTTTTSTTTAGAGTGTETESGAGTATESETETGAETESGGGAGIVPWVVIGVGGALVIGGAVTGAMASAKESDLEEMCPMDVCTTTGWEDTRDSGQTLATVADILFVTGALTAAAGVALLFLLDDTSAVERYPTASATAGCTTDGCAVSFRSSF